MYKNIKNAKDKIRKVACIEKLVNKDTNNKKTYLTL